MCTAFTVRGNPDHSVYEISGEMSTDDGYVMDVAYPPHFHKEIQPVWLNGQAQFLGATAPDLCKPYSYCELGCGMGINLLIAAATNPQGQFLGVDANEQALAFAIASAKAIGLKNLRFIHADFSQFAQNNSLFFDFIVSHGVWSWIAPAQQASILRLVAKSLKPRGLFYLHYMCHPGATRMIPVQRLMNDLARQLPGTSQEKLVAALDFVCKLDAAGAFADQPDLSDRINTLKQQHPAYLAHDFLTDRWAPQHSVDVHQLVAQTGVTYIGSANAFDNLETLCVPSAVQPLLTGLASPALRETVKDLAANRHQRTDLFQKAPARLNPQQVLAQIDALRFQALSGAPRSGALTFRTPIGEIEGPAEVLSPLLEHLDQSPATFAELRQLPAFGTHLALLSQSLQLLLWQGHAHAQRPENLDTDKVGKLQTWIERHQLRLKVVPECGTAMHWQPDTKH